MPASYTLPEGSTEYMVFPEMSEMKMETSISSYLKMRDALILVLLSDMSLGCKKKKKKMMLKL